ncbi:TerC family protein [Chelativorans sp. AA-79]|uniref:TerC family protein n=1 Tax=Chelativorans sp. AA-79 TaxID=3028735 RepID=UPI0023F7D1E4|nr:TerC family protein [Chelativorans sp. AA-79]WEX07500.1 TerC family protein [Chelativorans sp. AA-79]
MEFFTGAGLAALLQVIVIDLVLAGDNAVVIGLAANGLPASQRTRAILVGILAATVLRIVFATIAVEMLQIVGLALVGGFLLLWVCWRMWREIRASRKDAPQGALAAEAGTGGEGAPRKTFREAAMQIVVADVSMSLDNVLAVAGAARDHPSVLIIGLALSIALMGLAASLIARLLDRYRWIAYIGLLIVLYVALEMIYHGSVEVSGPLADLL